MSNKKNKNTIRTKIVNVTPRMAQNWLDQHERLSGKDRGLRKEWVRKLAVDMSAGEFKLTHQGIAFNCDGRRLDGQHRLRAIVESGATVQMLVTTGLPANIQGVIDLNAVRTLVDGVNISDGEPANINAVKTTVSMYQGNEFRKRLTRRQQIEFFQKYREQLTWACVQLPGNSKVGRAGVRAAVARAYINANGSAAKISKIKRFCEILREGQLLGKHEDGVRNLRDFLLSNKQYAGSTASLEVYSKASRTLYMFMTGTSVSRIRMTSENYFPIPEDATSSTRQNAEATQTADAAAL